MGALDDMLDIVRNYLPLYSAMDGGHRIIGGQVRLTYNIHMLLLLGKNGFLAAGAAVGVAFYLEQAKLTKSQHRTVLLYASLAIVFAIYPVISGKFLALSLDTFFILAICMYFSFGCNFASGSA